MLADELEARFAADDFIEAVEVRGRLLALDFGDITALEWFAVATGRIDVLRGRGRSRG